MSRYQYHVFVCENQRPLDDPKGCCSSKGSADLIAGLREKVKAAGLNSKIRINSSGCLSNCARGASVVVYPDAVWYTSVKADDLADIFEQHLQNGQPVVRLMDPVFHAATKQSGATS